MEILILSLSTVQIISIIGLLFSTYAIVIEFMVNDKGKFLSLSPTEWTKTFLISVHILIISSVMNVYFLFFLGG